MTTAAGLGIILRDVAYSLVGRDIYADSNDLSPEERLGEDLRSLKSETRQGIASGKCDEVFKRVLAQCRDNDDRKLAHELAYALFSGPRAHQLMDFYFNRTFLVLCRVRLDEELSTKDLCILIQKVFEDFKSECAKYVSNSTIRVPLRSIYSTLTSRSPTSWNGFNDGEYAPDDMVVLHHGGGRRHIESFLAGDNNSGYYCDYGVKGIFLTPFTKSEVDIFMSWRGDVDKGKIEETLDKSRVSFYAKLMPLKHCDDPHIIAVKVPCKYLYSVVGEANGVVLQQKDYSKMQMIYSKTLENVGTGQLMLLTDSSIKEAFETVFKENPGLESKIFDSLEKLRQRK